jgi:hypothetical protein
VSSDGSIFAPSLLHRGDAGKCAKLEHVYRNCWLAIAIAAVVAVFTFALVRMDVAWLGFTPIIVLSALLAALEKYYGKNATGQRISLACGMIAVLIPASILAGAIAHASLRMGRPFVDQNLSAIDQAIRWHSPDVVIAFAAYPSVSSVLSMIYHSSLPVCIACALAIAVSGRAERAAEFAWIYVLCILVAAVSAIFFPALGSTVYHGIEGISGLPVDAGNFHLPIVEYYRNDPSAVFSPGKMTGVVTFPSFHTVMAMVVPYALRGKGFVFLFAVSWASLVILSSVVIGGHYLVDLVAGCLCWAVAARTVSWRSSV